MADWNLKSLLSAHFSLPGALPALEWRRVKSRIERATGEVVESMDNVEAPSHWSQLAVDIAVSKYFRKRGAGGLNQAETSVAQLVDRVLAGITAEWADVDLLRAELRQILLWQFAAFNSPVWFNSGLHQVYGLKGPGGSYRYQAESSAKVEAVHSYEFPQTSACFIQSLQDDLASIFDLVKSEARIFKFGSGTGTNFSTLRSRHEPLESGGVSSGLISFLEVFDRGAAATKSGGTVRRAAKMVCLDYDHPEIFEFVEWKAREEKKARVLAAAGYGSDFEDESYRTVSGQNGNNSVRVTDEFMQAVVNDGKFATTWRTTGDVQEIYPARKLWSAISHAAWECADPGLQFHTTINRWHTCPQAGPIRASNPCAEFLFLDDTACNLASINLAKLLQPDASFGLKDFLQVIRLLIISQERLVEIASYPTPKIAENSWKYRPLGLGFANLGGFLMRSGLAYGSETARDWAAWLAATLQAQALLVSTELAEQLGPFAGFAENRDSCLEVMKKHQTSFLQRSFGEFSPDLLAQTRNIWELALRRLERFGLRHAQLTAIAPTGTIGLLMDCDTTGIEPDFSLVKFKKMAGGGYVKIVNQSVPPALKRLGYASGQIQDILTYLERESGLEGAPHLKAEDLAVFDCANPCGSRSQRHLHWRDQLQMLAAVQPFISGGISKTVNLPASAKVEDIEAVMLEAWKLGLKAISIYRDGSKGSQPLNQHKADALDQFVGSVMSTPKCAECGHLTVLSGNCFKCLNCGQTTSC